MSRFQIKFFNLALCLQLKTVHSLKVKKLTAFGNQCTKYEDEQISLKETFSILSIWDFSGEKIF